MNDCLFCKIINGEIPGSIVYRDDRLVAFNDINPQAPLHALIVPTRHIATLNPTGISTSSRGISSDRFAPLGLIHRRPAIDAFTICALATAASRTSGSPRASIRRTTWGAARRHSATKRSVGEPR